MQTCYGCGAEADQHPWVAVISSPGGELFVAEPICAPCHQDPQHRSKLPGGRLKGHFFPAGQAALALSRAGSSHLGQP